MQKGGCGRKRATSLRTVCVRVENRTRYLLNKELEYLPLNKQLRSWPVFLSACPFLFLKDYTQELVCQGKTMLLKMHPDTFPRKEISQVQQLRNCTKKTRGKKCRHTYMPSILYRFVGKTRKMNQVKLFFSWKRWEEYHVNWTEKCKWRNRWELCQGDTRSTTCKKWG